MFQSITWGLQLTWLTFAYNNNRRLSISKFSNYP